MRRLAILMLMTVSALLQAQEISHSAQPTVIHKTDPAYTGEALAAKIQGTVILQLVIGTDAIPSEIHVVRGLGYGLDEKAVACLRAWRFSPATRFGEPVATKARVEIEFRLPPDK
jgi:protein TonB